MYNREEAISYLDDMAQEWECSREQWETAVFFLSSMKDDFECRLLIGKDASLEISWEEPTARYIVYINDDGILSLYRSDTDDFVENIELSEIKKAMLGSCFYN